MAQTEPARPQVPKVVRFALIGGTYLFMSAWFIAYSRSAHHTMVYAGFIGPALVHLLYCVWHRDPTVTILKSPLFVSLALFLAYMAASTFWSDNADSFAHYLKRLSLTLVFVYGIYVIVRFEPRHFWRSVLCALALCGPWLAINLLFYPDEAFISNRFKGANAGLHYLLTGAMLGAFFVIGTNHLMYGLERRGLQARSFLLLAALGAVFYGVLLTESRSALLALAVTAAYWALSTRQIRQLKFIALPALLAFGVLLTPYLDLFISRGFSNRFEIWETSLQWILQRPWLGHGFDALFILPISSGEELYDPHNIHLAVLYNGGLVGGILWAGFLGILAWQGWVGRHTPLGKCVLALLIYTVSVKFFESRGILSRPTEFWYLLWLCAGMALACRNEGDESAANKHSCAPALETTSVE